MNFAAPPPRRHRFRSPSLVLAILALAYSHFAAAEERYTAEYYDDGENLHFVDAWEDPFAQPDPESDFFQTLIIPRSGGGECCGTGQTNGAEGLPKTDEGLPYDNEAPNRGESTSSSRGRRFPGVLSTGRRINAEGLIRVFLAQDSGDQFSILARRAREEPPETQFVVDLSCSDDTEIRKLALARIVLPLHLAEGTSVTAIYPDGTDTWVIACSSECTPTTILGGEAIPASTTGACH